MGLKHGFLMVLIKQKEWAGRKLSLFVSLNSFFHQQYDSSSLPALLFEARTVLGAKKHLKTINYQLGKLLEQEWEDQKLSQPPAAISPEAALLTTKLPLWE